MGNDRIAAVNDSGVITAFVEHTHIHAQYVGQIDGTSGTAGIGADHHGVVTGYLKVRFCLEKTFDKLVGRLYRLKAVQRDGILHAGVMGIKGNDIVHTHVH